MGLDNLSPAGTVVIGVFVGLLSTSIQSLGLTLQRKSHILEDEKGPHEIRRPPYRRIRWQLGMGMFIISNIVGSTIQITTLPLPVLSTLQASGLVFNSICATLILGEAFTRWSFGGTMLVCGGAILIAIFGAIPEPAHNLNQLLVLLSRRQFILWMIGQAIIVILIIVGTKALKLLYPRSHNSPKMRLLRGMAYGAISGILSAHSLLVAKSAVELLVRTIIDRKNQFDRWQSWVILLGLIVLALSQLYYLHRGLKLCSTSILYPFVFCIYNIIAILDGLIYFKQVSRLSVPHALLIALGTVILLAGVLALSWRLNNDPTTQTAVPSTPLAPGMGFVDDTDSEADDDTRSDYTTTTLDDEEALQETPERQPLLASSNGDATSRAMTPTTKDNTILSVTKSRRQGMTEAAEIWGELEDDKPTYKEGSRRASTMSLPSRFSRRGTVGQEDGVNESTSLLRAGTSRSLGRRAGNRRRSSMRASRRDSQQDALGGWWKMKWWKRRKGDGDGDED